MDNEKKYFLINSLHKENTDSSLKNQNYKGMSAEEIIQYYEEVLESRERQVYELSLEVGKVHEKMQNLTAKLDISVDKNTKYKETLERKEKFLQNELSNKEIIFIQLNSKEREYDDLQSKIDDIIRQQNQIHDQSQKNLEEGVINNPLNNLEKGDKKDDKKKKNENDNYYINNKDEDKKDNEKTFFSTRERINLLKSKNENIKKVNFAELLKNKNINNNNDNNCNKNKNSNSISSEK